MEYNGGSVVAMVGKDCVALASDKRFGSNMTTISNNFPKLFEISKKAVLGVSGLATDVQTLYVYINFCSTEILKYKTDLFKLQENRAISPKSLAFLISSTLYSKRSVACFYIRFSPFFVEPIVAGIDSNSQPFICSTDVIGCINFAKDFVVSGTASPNLYGICESFYEDNMVSTRRFLISGSRHYF